jgi:hypothetical protein
MHDTYVFSAHTVEEYQKQKALGESTGRAKPGQSLFWASHPPTDAMMMILAIRESHSIVDATSS